MQLGESGVKPGEVGRLRYVTDTQLGGSGCRPLIDAAHHAVQLPVYGLTPQDQRRFKSLEPGRTKQGAQHRAAVVGFGKEKLLEPVLREQDHLEELVDLERQNTVEFVAHVDRSGRHTDPLIAPAHLEHGIGLRDGGSPASFLRPGVPRCAVDPVPLAAEAEDELDKGRIIGRTVVAPQRQFAAIKTWDLRVERETNGVEDTRLAGPGFARDQKDTVVIEPFEVDELFGLVRTKTGKPQTKDFHARAPFLVAGVSWPSLLRSVSFSVRISATRAASNSVGPTPLRTYSRKPATISGSDFARTRSR